MVKTVNKMVDDERIRANLAGNLTRLRWANGLTCNELAELAGCGDPQQVSRAEKKGKLPRADLLARWALALGVTSDFLLFHPAEPVYLPDDGQGREATGYAELQRPKYVKLLAKARTWVRTAAAKNGRRK